MLKNIIFSLLFAGAFTACGDDTEPVDTGGEPAPIACDEGQACPDGTTCNGTICEELAIDPLACDDETACPIGATCNSENLCEGEAPVTDDAPQACDIATPCNEGLDCVDDICTYSAEGSACTSADADAVCGLAGFCSFSLEQTCGIDDAVGVCSDGFNDAPSAEEAVVCGCDGNSYWNADQASINQINVASEGLCEAPEEMTSEI